MMPHIIARKVACFLPKLVVWCPAPPTYDGFDD